MSKRKAQPASKTVAAEPEVKGTGLSVLYVLDNLAAGRTPEELVKHHPALSVEAIESAQKQLLFSTHYQNRTAFYEHIRVRHLVAALRPHPVAEKICDAFKAVSLGSGLSLQQLLCTDRYGEDESGRPSSRQEFAQLRYQDEINHWQAIKLIDIDRCWAFAHSNAEGFRYYIPARMIQDIASPLQISSEVIACLNIQRHSDWYALLDNEQKQAIASYLWNGLNAFSPAEQMQEKELIKKIQQVLDSYWLQYL